MPRLKVVEPPQHAFSTGGAVTKRARQNSKRRPKGSLAATAEAGTPNSTKTTLSPNRQSALLVRYNELPTGKEEHSAALRNLCAEFEVGISLPARLLKTVKASGKLPTRKGKGGRNKVITEEEEERIMELLDEEAYDITFVQMEKRTSASQRPPSNRTSR